MIGAIAGDIIGSIYEGRPLKSKAFPLFSAGCRFTDDTVLTIAVADAIVTGAGYKERLLSYGRQYPRAGYGGAFIRWLKQGDPQPYNSWGNGAAMRVSPVGFAFETEEAVLAQAQKTAAVSHNHPEGIKGAQAVALAVFLARTRHDKKAIRSRISQRFGYNLDRTVDSIRPDYCFDVSCQGSVPEAIVAFLDADSWEDAVRNAVSLGGDSDTQACIAGAIAEAYYGPVPDDILSAVETFLTPHLLETTQLFYRRYLLPLS